MKNGFGFYDFTTESAGSENTEKSRAFVGVGIISDK